MKRTYTGNEYSPLRNCAGKLCTKAKTILALGLSLSLLTALSGAQESTGKVENQAEAPQIVLLDGTAIKLRLNRSISSESATVGQPVDFAVTEDVAVNGIVLIPKGSAAMGKVTVAVPKRRMGRAGKLDIVLEYVRLADSEKAPVRAVKEAKGKSRTGGMTVGIVATGLLFWPAAPLFLLMHGKDITIPEGAEVTAFADGDLKLEAAKFAPKNGVEVASAPAAVPTTVATPPILINNAPETDGLVEVQSNPGPAEIDADGTFVSNTPATLHLSPGTHSIRVSLSGYKDWSQEVTVETGAKIHLSANLEKQE
jgi:hypothetical protein